MYPFEYPVSSETMTIMVRSAASSVSTVVVHSIATGKRLGIGASDVTESDSVISEPYLALPPRAVNLSALARDQRYLDSPSATLPVNRTSTIKALPTEYYNDFLSKQAKKRQPNSSEFSLSNSIPCWSLMQDCTFSWQLVRELLPLELTPGVISLLAGKPNAFSFPITGLTIDVRSAADAPNTLGKPMTLSSEALADGLQYGITAGYKPLVDWLEGLQAYSHGRKSHEGWRLSMACGSQDALYKVCYVELV